jgi:hypothetical protein
MSTSIARNLRFLAAAGAVAAFMLMALGTDARAASTVTISGNAYAFIFAGNEDRLEGATIGIAEIPDLTTTAGPNGFYALEVPDNTTITPFARIDGYYTTHHQTFHTRGQDLRQVNFQMPELSTYTLLANGVDADRESDGTLSKCGIVSTFFQKEGRSFLDFNDFHDFRPHGVEGSTAESTPLAGGGPLYFNPSVIPDPTQPSSSRDGGVLWVNVESGVYNVKGFNDETRHASFVATCAPGRLVNANPPWGLYELAGNEETNPATLPAAPDRDLDAWLYDSRIVRQGARRSLRMKLTAREPVSLRIRLRQGTRVRNWQRSIGEGKPALSFPVPASFRQGSARLTVTIRDRAGNSASPGTTLFVPAPKRR